MQTVRGVAQAAPWYNDESDERLLIHISYSPSRFVIFITSIIIFPDCNLIIVRKKNDPSVGLLKY